ncbi:MAG: sugar transferase [Owenweeksia sp.]|nr:sugar transferase [Owenweeksia sp.]
MVVLLIFPWLYPILAIGVKLSGQGPVFFRQKRTGLGDDAFTILKFRSMALNAEADSAQAVMGDPRITQFGQFMRRHNLDELPQFFNVLKGDMSVVGPRPHMVAHTETYRQII